MYTFLAARLHRRATSETGDESCSKQLNVPSGSEAVKHFGGIDYANLVEVRHYHINMANAKRMSHRSHTGRVGDKKRKQPGAALSRAGPRGSRDEPPDHPVKVSAPRGSVIGCLTPLRLSNATEGGDVSKIHIIDMSSCSITSAEDMEQCRELRRLDLPSNQLSSLHYFEMNLNLRWINLASNFINKIANLGRLSQLAVLNLSNNRIHEVGSLTGLRSLKTLVLSNNEITSVGSLENLPNLETLILSHNNIESFAPGKGVVLPKLKKLSIGHNLLREMPDPPKFPALQELRLNSNKIQVIPDSVKFLPDLRILDIGNTCILSIKSIQALAVLKRLENLNILGSERIFEEEGVYHFQGMPSQDRNQKHLEEFFRRNRFPALRILNSRKFSQTQGFEKSLLSKPEIMKNRETEGGGKLCSDVREHPAQDSTGMKVQDDNSSPGRVMKKKIVKKLSSKKHRFERLKALEQTGKEVGGGVIAKGARSKAVGERASERMKTLSCDSTALLLGQSKKRSQSANQHASEAVDVSEGKHSVKAVDERALGRAKTPSCDCTALLSGESKKRSQSTNQHASEAVDLSQGKRSVLKGLPPCNEKKRKPTSLGVTAKKKSFRCDAPITSSPETRDGKALYVSSREKARQGLDSKMNSSSKAGDEEGDEHANMKIAVSKGRFLSSGRIAARDANESKAANVNADSVSKPLFSGASLRDSPSRNLKGAVQGTLSTALQTTGNSSLKSSISSISRWEDDEGSLP